MNHKFHILTLSLILAVLFFSLAPAVLAQNSLNAPSPDVVANEIGTSAGYNTNVSAETGLASFLGFIVRILLSFLGLFFVVYVIYAGFLWLTSAGSEEKIDKAKKIFRDGLIGLVITLSAVGIYLLTTGIIGDGSSGTFTFDLLPNDGGSKFESNW